MSDFYISAKVKADLSDIQSQLNQSAINIPFNVDVGEIDNFNQQISNSTQVAQNSLNQLNTASKKVTRQLDENGKVVKTTVRETKQLNNALVTTKTDFDKEGKVIGSTVAQTEKFSNAQIQAKNSLEGLKNKIKTIGEDFISTTGKVAKFALSTALIGAFTSAVGEAKQAVVEFDSALTELKKVSDLSDDALADYTKKLGELGQEVGRTRSEMTELATGFRKAGFTEEDSAMLAKVGALYQNIADEELTASESTSVLVSQIKAFKMEAEDSVHIIDSINEVANQFAVSSGDIGKGLTAAGAALSTYGNDFEQVIGLLTAG